MNIQTTPEVMEALFKGLLQNEVNLSDILAGLHNACSHGTFINGIDADEDDKELGRIMGGLEMALEASRKIEKECLTL